MLQDLLPFSFHLDTIAVAGTTVWALALYLGFPALGQWIAAGLTRWFNFAERSLYFSEAEFERTRQGRESQNAFLASVLSIVPFLGVGVALHYGVEWGLGEGWSLSLALITAIISAVYELGRRDSAERD